MVLRRNAIEERLKELDETLQELNKYSQIEVVSAQANLSRRWIIERGLIAAASLIFDIANHILAGHFGLYVETYEQSLRGLHDQAVISTELYHRLKGLGGFRNILVHRYLDIDPGELLDNFQKGLTVFPRFAQEILAWLDNDEQVRET